MRKTETKKPRRIYCKRGFKKLVELPSVKGSNADNSQISTDATV